MIYDAQIEFKSITSVMIVVLYLKPIHTCKLLWGICSSLAHSHMMFHHKLSMLRREIEREIERDREIDR